MSILKTLCLSASILMAPLSQAASALGDWLTVDDETGEHQAVITMQKASDGSMSGVVKTLLVNQGMHCHKCRDARKGQPVKGMEIIWGLKPKDATHWEDGTVLDPTTGKTYHLKASLTAAGNLKLHAYVAVSMIGRTQTWVREQ